MELKHVIPNIEKTFGHLEFAGENKVEQRRINGRMAVVYIDDFTVFIALIIPQRRMNGFID